MKSFVTLTTGGQLMYFMAADRFEANYICSGENYIELPTPVRNCATKSREDLLAFERELYRKLTLKQQ